MLNTFESVGDLTLCSRLAGGQIAAEAQGGPLERVSEHFVHLPFLAGPLHRTEQSPVAADTGRWAVSRAGWWRGEAHEMRCSPGRSSRPK